MSKHTLARFGSFASLATVAVLAQACTLELTEGELDDAPSRGSIDSGGAGSSTGGSSGAGAAGSAGHMETREARINNYILDECGTLPLPPEQPPTEQPCDASCPEPAAPECAVQRYTETAHVVDVAAFEPHSAVLWPGNVVRGGSAQQGVLVPVGVELAPVTFSVSLENIAGSPVGTMSSPALSSFRAERNRILSTEVTGATSARLSFDVRTVSSSSELSLVLGADSRWQGCGATTQSLDLASLSASESSTRVVANFTQAYYSIDADTPLSPADFFAPSVDVDQLRDVVNAEEPPVYVQSITYGRRVVLSVESSSTASAVQAALSEVYESCRKTDSEWISASAEAVLDASTIRATVVGGSGADAVGVIDGWQGLRDFILAGGDYSKQSPGAPIAYKLAYLDNAVVKHALTADYAEQVCEDDVARDLYASLDAVHDLSGGEGNGAEFFGAIGFYYPSDTHSGGCGFDPEDRPPFAWLYSGDHYSALSQPASETVAVSSIPSGPDASICLVAQLKEVDAFYDDDYGIASVEIPANEWDRTHVLRLDYYGNVAEVRVGLEMR